MREHARLVAAMLIAACGSPETGNWTAGTASCALDDVDAACSAPATPLTATSTISTAPAIDASITYAIASPAGKHAYVVFTPATSGRHTIYFGTEDEMQVCELTAACASMTTCPALAVAAQYLMDAGLPYDIEVPAGATDFRLRVEAPPSTPPPPPPPPSTADIVFAAALDGQAEPDLYRMRADGTGIVRLTTTTGAELYPTWSPARDRIAFVRDFQLFVRNADGSNERLVAAQTGRERLIYGMPYRTTLSHAGWSPDGTRLVYPYPLPPREFEEEPGQIVDQSYGTTLHIVNADGTNDQAIPNINGPPGSPEPRGTFYGPVWTAGDNRILFVDDDDCPDCAGGGWYDSIRPDGTGLIEIINTMQQGLDVSSTNRWVYVAPPSDWQYELPGVIYTAPAYNPSAQTQVAAGGWSPHWSPTGASIAYIGSDGIYVMAAGGGNQVRILPVTNVRGLDW